MIRVALPFGIGTPESKRGSYRDALNGAGIQPVENVTTLTRLARKFHTPSSKKPLLLA